MARGPSGCTAPLPDALCAGARSRVEVGRPAGARERLLDGGQSRRQAHPHRLLAPPGELAHERLVPGPAPIPRGHRARTPWRDARSPAHAGRNTRMKTVAIRTAPNTSWTCSHRRSVAPTIGARSKRTNVLTSGPRPSTSAPGGARTPAAQGKPAVTDSSLAAAAGVDGRRALRPRASAAGPQRRPRARPPPPFP